MKTSTIKSLNQIINNQNKRGRKYKVSLVYQIVITLFKLKYNLPDRVLEKLLDIDHVTISKITN